MLLVNLGGFPTPYMPSVPEKLLLVENELRENGMPDCRLRSSHHWWPHPATAPRTPLTTIVIRSKREKKPPF